MFHKLYYDNGSHAGCIVYIGAGQVDEAVKETLTGARGKGAFKLHAPGGGKDSVHFAPDHLDTAIALNPFDKLIRNQKEA